MGLFYFLTTKSLSSIIENDDVDSLKRIIKNKQEADSSIISETSESKLSLIYTASCKGGYKCLFYLLKIGADPNSYSYIPLFKQYCSPLFLAVYNKYIPLIGLLILHGANADLPYKDKVTGSPRSKASSDIQEIIIFFENIYHQIKELEDTYNKKKYSADSAYKKEGVLYKLLSRGLYTDAYNCRYQMKKIWQQVAEIEKNIIIKSYYEEKVKEQDDSMKILKSVSNIDEPKNLDKSDPEISIQDEIDMNYPEFRYSFNSPT